MTGQTLPIDPRGFMVLHRFLLASAAVAVATHPAGAQTPAQDPAMATAIRVLRSSPLIDGHNDLPWHIRESPEARGSVESYDLRRRTTGHTDLARLRAGMLGGQFWSIYIPGEIGDSGYARVQLEQIDIARQMIAKYPEAFQWALTADGMRQAFAAGRIGSVLGLEGGHAIENSLGALRVYYDMGARYMTLTHNVTLDWADAALDQPRHGGLTAFGAEVVREMNRLGMLVDLSHVSPGTMSDALNVTEAPVIFSHSGPRALVDHPRNVPDSILRRLPANGGVVMVPFVTSFVSPAVWAHDQARDRQAASLRQRHGSDSMSVRRELEAWDRANPAPVARLSDVADAIDYVRRVAGVDHVGIGSDFDGITETIEGLEDVATFPALFAELARRGWSEADLRKLAGENVLRAMSRAEEVSTRLRRERGPSTRTIRELDGKPEA
ncbi:MAG: rane dipeptidase [Gemmatimonadetes bacterium]|nr:rane dipeptidase [Gemmatimonadota bacterium]